MDTSSKEGQTRMIHVQTETKNLDLSVDLACNVQGLKESIEEVEGIPVQQQEIILNGKELNHGEDLPQQDELTLQLVVKSDSNVEESAAGNFSTEAAEEEYTEADFEDSTSLDKVDSANQDIKEKDKETASVNTGLDSPNPQKAGSPISVAFLDDGVDSLISDHYQTLTDMLSKRVEELTSGHFKSYTQLSVLQQTANHISSHMKHNEDFLLKMSKALEITMNSLSKLNKTIINKIEEEHLQTWLSTPITSQDASEQSKSRDLMAKAAELREAVAASELQFAAVTKLCAEMEVNTAEAQQMAIDARIAAEEAARKVEEAEKAAREKARIEEEKRQKAKELEKRQQEEERIRLEKETKRKAEMAELKGTPEEQERINPANWPTYTYRLQTANDFDASYSCIIRALPGVLAQDDVTVTKVYQLESKLQLENNDELISNIIQLKPSLSSDGDGDDASISSHSLENIVASSEEPLSVLLPHCAPRNTSKEIIVLWKPLHSLTWQAIDAKDCNIESVKDAKLVECRPTGLGVFAVVHRLKTDKFAFTKKGGKVFSTVDGRLCVQCRPGAFRVNTPFSMQIQPVELASVSDVKVRFPDECSDLISSSPIVSLQFPSSKLNRPISIITPIPANSAKPKRPVTAVPEKEKPKSSSRPASAFGLGSYSKEEEEGDNLHLLALTNNGYWIVTDEMEFTPQNKKGDLISVNTTVIPNKYWLLRTKASTSSTKAELIANTLYDYLHKRVVQFIIKQKGDDPTDIVLVCTPTLKFDRTVRRLEDEGYSEAMKLSPEVFVREGQKIEIKFRGNLQPDEDVDLVLPYNSHLKTQVNMYIAEIDKYAQKSFSSYRGFAQFYVEGLVTREIYEDNDKKRGDRKSLGTEEVWDTIMLSELLISLPKPEPEAPKPLKKAKINLVSEGPIDDNLLKQLSGDLGDEWKMLATHLNVKKTRIQSIMRNHVNCENEPAIYEMLLTWVKRVPRSLDKVKVLCDALRAVGRLDLVEDVRDKEYDYKELRAEQLKENLLKVIFVKIAQHPAGLTRYGEIAAVLKVSDEELRNIENEYSNGRERCIKMLESWRNEAGESASPNTLLRAAKYLRLTDLAGEIRRMITY